MWSNKYPWLVDPIVSRCCIFPISYGCDTVPIKRRWSFSMSAPLLLLTPSSEPLHHFLLMMILSIWFAIRWTLWRSLWGIKVFPITSLWTTQNSTKNYPFSCLSLKPKLPMIFCLSILVTHFVVKLIDKEYNIWFLKAVKVVWSKLVKMMVLQSITPYNGIVALSCLGSGSKRMIRDWVPFQ